MRLAVKSYSIIKYILLGIWTLLILGVVGWVLFSSLKTNVEIFQKPWGFPSKIVLENYIFALTKSKMGLYFINSVMVISISLISNIFIASMASYIISRFIFKFRRLIFGLFLFGMAVPFQLLLVPNYEQLMNLGLVNTRIGLIFVFIALWLPFTIFVLTGFFKTIPYEMEESAVLEGCSELLLFWKIMFPLARTGVIAVAVINFIDMWNEYMLALVYISNSKLRTLSLGMYALMDSMKYASNWGALFAAVIIMLIPSSIVFISLRKYIIQGLTLGAVKG